MASTVFLLFSIAAIIYLFLYYFQFYLKWKNGPPGPIPIPLFGNILTMARLQLSTKPSPSGAHVISLMTKKYGDVWRLRIGAKDFVVCCSVPAVMEIMTRDETLGRELFGLFYDRVDGKMSGIVTSEGVIWEKQRRWTFKNLNSLGLRKRGGGILSAIYQQLSPVLSKFEMSSNLSNELEVGPLFLLPASKVVFSFIIGSRVNEKEVELQLEECIEESEKMAKSAEVSGGIDVAFPFLRKIFPKFIGRNQVLHLSNITRKFAQNVLREAGENKNEETLASLFLKDMEENPEDETFSEFHFGTIFLDLLQASSDTTSSYVQFLILYAILFPSCQERIFEEINSVVEKDEEIELEHRAKMKYTDAFMLETHRYGVIVPSFSPHRVTTDFICEKSKYVIPKGSIIMSDMFTANVDKRIWANPEDFDPNRFVENPQLKKFVLPFGAGKRSCPGEAIAEWTAFIFFTNILRKFKLSQIPEAKLTKNHVEIGFSCTPKPFSVLISKR